MLLLAAHLKGAIMPITVAGTNITMNDATVQATAFLGARGQVFTGNGTFTIPTGVTAVKVTVVGGGGGAAAFGAGAGAGGGSAIKFLTSLTSGNTLSVTVGAGGTGSAGSTGGTGGTSQVASGTQSITTISATGGAGGNQTLGGSVGGIGSNGDLNIKGQSTAAETVFIGCVSYNTYPVGGSSILGGGAKRGIGSGGAGGAYGGGAGANDSGGTGSSGAAGVVIFEW